jgi:hypothetical protein
MNYKLVQKEKRKTSSDNNNYPNGRYYHRTSEDNNHINKRIRTTISSPPATPAPVPYKDTTWRNKVMHIYIYVIL